MAWITQTFLPLLLGFQENVRANLISDCGVIKMSENIALLCAVLQDRHLDY